MIYTFLCVSFYPVGHPSKYYVVENCSNSSGDVYVALDQFHHKLFSSEILLDAGNIRNIVSYHLIIITTFYHLFMF